MKINQNIIQLTSFPQVNEVYFLPEIPIHIIWELKLLKYLKNKESQ